MHNQKIFDRIIGQIAWYWERKLILDLGNSSLILTQGPLTNFFFWAVNCISQSEIIGAKSFHWWKLWDVVEKYCVDLGCRDTLTVICSASSISFIWQHPPLSGRQIWHVCNGCQICRIKWDYAKQLVYVALESVFEEKCIPVFRDNGNNNDKTI